MTSSGPFECLSNHLELAASPPHSSVTGPTIFIFKNLFSGRSLFQAINTINKEYQEVYYLSIYWSQPTRLWGQSWHFPQRKLSPDFPGLLHTIGKAVMHSLHRTLGRLPRAWGLAKMGVMHQPTWESPLQVQMMGNSLRQRTVCVSETGFRCPQETAHGSIKRSVPLGELVGFKVNPAKMLLAEVWPLRQQYLKVLM